MSAYLTYYIFEGVLTGFTAGRTIHMIALSGGRGGTTKRAAETSAVNNPYMTGLETGYHSVGGKRVHGETDVHGGPIPPGRYSIGKPFHHTRLGLCAQLSPTRAKTGMRDGFFIHGRGPHGSDGCIVVLNAAHLRALMHALQQDRGGSLYVFQAMGNSGFA